MNKFLLPVTLLILLSLEGCKSPGINRSTIYYIDQETGNDANTGTSPGKPWKSLGRISENKFAPGDHVLLKTGQVFPGGIRLTGLKGCVAAPVVISTYGGGKAVIESADSAAIVAEDCSFLVCRNLILRGSGRLNGNIADGILFRHVTYGSIDSLEASGYLYSGIHVAGGSNISIAHANVHDNGFCGIFTESGEREYGSNGEKFKTLQHVYIGYSLAANNPGCPAISDNHSGNGILMAGVVNGLIEYCEAMNNGWDMPREGNGPVGIWAYMSDSVIIQHCYSHHNKTSRFGKDGGGFDFDGGMRYSILQYNLAAFNEGAGFGIFQYAGATAWAGNIARYNISYNDGIKNSQAGIFMWCDPVALPMSDFHAYNNTVVTSLGAGANFEPGAYEGFLFENNIFLVTGKTDRFIDGSYTGAVFHHNVYWSSFTARQPKIPDTDVDAILTDPKLILPSGQSLSAVITDSLHTLPEFRLSPVSPVLKKGKIIHESGGFDFWRNPVNDHDVPNPGAWQGY